MRFKLLLLSACAAVCLSAPGASFADPPGNHDASGDQGSHGDQSGQHAEGPANNQGAQAQVRAHQGAKGPPANPTGPQGVQAQVLPHKGSQGQPANPTGPQGVQAQVLRHQGQPANPTAPQGVQAQVLHHQGAQPVNPTGPQGVQAQVLRHQGAQPVNPIGPQGIQAQVQHNPVGKSPPPLTTWNRSVRGPQRVQFSQQWRTQNQNWDRSAPWRADRNWWRRDPGFRLYSGVRIGFFFFPDIGYVSAPPQYWNHHWGAGDYLPRWFWRYRVRDPYHYGLPTPPYGCDWIWLNGSVALGELSDGYIIDMVYNVW